MIPSSTASSPYTSSEDEAVTSSLLSLSASDGAPKSPKPRISVNQQVEIYESETLGKVTLLQGKISPLSEGQERSPHSIIRKGRYSDSQRDDDSFDLLPFKIVNFPPVTERPQTPQPSPTQSKKESPKSKRKSSDPEKWKLRTKEGRTPSLLELLKHVHTQPSYNKAKNPYDNLSLTYHETVDSINRIALQDPFRLMVGLNRLDDKDRNASLNYRKVVIEKGDERTTIKTTDLVDDVKKPPSRKSKHADRELPKRRMTNEELLIRIFTAIYEAGYVSHKPTSEKVKQEIDLLYLTGPQFSSKKEIDPRAEFMVYNAHIPAYRLLCAMPPSSSLEKTNLALRFAFPNVFPNREHIEKVNADTIADGKTRYYLATEKKEIEEEDKDQLTIKVIEPDKAEVIHKRCITIFANIVTRLDDYAHSDDDTRDKKYWIHDTRVPLGEMEIDFTLKEKKTKKGEGFNAYPLFSVDLRPIQITQYGKKTLSKKLKRLDHIKTAFDEARRELRQSLKAQLKTQTYLLDDKSILKCKEL